jgi:RNA polymerase sigma-70 factor (ECF subfamily)
MDEAPIGGAPGVVRPASPAQRWVAEHGDVLWRFALGRTRSRDAAEEVVQETIVAAMQASAGERGFAGASSERTWLLGIAAHKIADHYRQARRRAGRVDAESECAPGGAGKGIEALFTDKGLWARTPETWGIGPGTTAENSEILVALRACIDALPPGLGEAVWLRDLLGMPTEEVCKAMGVTPTNLWTRMHRARAALRACVEKSMGKEKGGAR